MGDKDTSDKNSPAANNENSPGNKETETKKNHGPPWSAEEKEKLLALLVPCWGKPSEIALHLPGRHGIQVYDKMRELCTRKRGRQLLVTFFGEEASYIENYNDLREFIDAMVAAKISGNKLIENEHLLELKKKIEKIESKLEQDEAAQHRFALEWERHEEQRRKQAFQEELKRQNNTSSARIASIDVQDKQLLSIKKNIGTPAGVQSELFRKALAVIRGNSTPVRSQGSVGYPSSGVKPSITARSPPKGNMEYFNEFGFGATTVTSTASAYQTTSQTREPVTPLEFDINFGSKVDSLRKCTPKKIDGVGVAIQRQLVANGLPTIGSILDLTADQLAEKSKFVRGLPRIYQLAKKMEAKAMRSHN